MSVLVPVLTCCVTPLAAVRSVSLERPLSTQYSGMVGEHVREFATICPLERLARPPLTSTKYGIETGKCCTDC